MVLNEICGTGVYTNCIRESISWESPFFCKSTIILIILLKQFLAALKAENLSSLVKFIGTYFSLTLFTIVMGVDVNAQDLNGRMSLHHSCMENSVVTTEFLLLWNANPNIQDGNGKSISQFFCRNYFILAPLHCATQAGSVDVVSLLLQRNALANIRDNANLLPIDYAEELSIINGGSFVRIVTILRLTKFEKEQIPPLSKAKGA